MSIVLRLKKLTEQIHNHHYHVLMGFHGCIPELNEVYDDIETSKDRLADIVKDLKETGNKLELDYDECYAEITEKTDALGDYIEISDCTEIDCIRELENE